MDHGLRWLAAAALLIGTTPTWAQSPPTKTISVAAGQEQQLSAFGNTNDTCSGVPTPEVQIVKLPADGRLILRLAVIRFPAEHPKCAGKQIPGISVVYKAGATPGPETAVIDIVAGKASQTQSYAITVTK